MAVKIAIILVLVKIVATSTTLGSGGSGGVFAPSLFIGAMLGESFGKLTHILAANIAIPPGACALVGMAAVFSGAAQAPISAILILFEMTQNYKIILPLMVTCVISTVVVKRLTKESIYTLKLKRRGIDIQEVKGLGIMEVVKVSRAMVKEAITVNETSTVRETGLMIKSTGHRGFPVIDIKGNLAGMVTRQDINRALSDGKAGISVKEIITKDIIYCYPDENLRAAVEKLGERNIGRIPVVERGNHSHLIGLVTRKSIIAAYNQALNRKRRYR